MKRLLVFLCTVLFLSGVIGITHAELIDNADGTVTQIKDDGSALMWAKDANLAGVMVWSDAMAWVDQLEYCGHDDWRLPTTPGTQPGFVNEGEMGHLFYDYGISSSSPGPFTNVRADLYWYGTEYSPAPDHAWFFFPGDGRQDFDTKDAANYAWAVRDLAPVPAPPSTVVDQVNPFADATQFEAGVDEVWQQEVTVGIEGYLVGIDLHWAINPGFNNNQLVFFLNVGPAWQSDVNDFEEVITFTVQNGWNYIDVSSAGLYFLPGDEFVIGVQNAFDNTSIGGSYFDQYPAGDLFLDGQNYTNGLWDIAFRTHVKTPPDADTFEWIINGGFESGNISGWSVTDSGGSSTPNPVPWFANDADPAEGNYSAFADGNFRLTQIFSSPIPASEIVSATAYIRQPDNPNLPFTTNLGLGFIYSDSELSGGGFFGPENWTLVDFVNPEFGPGLDVNKVVIGVYVDGYTSGNPGFDITEVDSISILGSLAVDTDGDGIPDDEDDCPTSDLGPTVVIDGCDSGVPNTQFGDGCTISDRIAELASSATNHGKFTSAVSHYTNDLKKNGDISGKQKGAIQSCAGQAGIP